MYECMRWKQTGKWKEDNSLWRNEEWASVEMCVRCRECVTPITNTTLNIILDNSNSLVTYIYWQDISWSIIQLFFWCFWMIDVYWLIENSDELEWGILAAIDFMDYVCIAEDQRVLDDHYQQIRTIVEGLDEVGNVFLHVANTMDDECRWSSSLTWSA